MRTRVVFPAFVLAAGLLLLPTIAFSQTDGPTEAPPPGWKTCPHCLTNKQARKDYDLDSLNLPFNPRDISGIWNSRPSKIGPNTQIIDTLNDPFAKELPPSGIPPKNFPGLTPYGKKLWEATKTDFKSPQGTAVTNSKDGMLKCDPLGWPRWFTYNYGFEIVVLPDRVLQFIEWGHTWRTIWTDGRKLPANPPEPRWLGYTIGHWEEDNTFVVESNGYDDRSWLSEAANFDAPKGSRGRGEYGWPHSDEMRITERWKRTSYATLEAQFTINDPKVYAAPWVAEPIKHTLLPDTEIWEYFCTPSDNDAFNSRVLIPSNGAAPPKNVSSK